MSITAVGLSLLISLRPKQWTKNSLVLFPLLFAVNKWWAPDDFSGMAVLISKSFAACGIFVLLSGGVYLLNDLADIKSDRIHQIKRFRPIASGALPVPLAWLMAFLIIALALMCSFVITLPFGFAALAYLLLMISYSAKLKHVVLIDVMAIALGFVLRALAGAMAIDGFVLSQIQEPLGLNTKLVLDVTVSPWLYICTGLGALFIALSKRRAELSQAGSNKQRPVLRAYTIGFLDQLIGIVAPATLVSYALYTFSGVGGANVPSNNLMMLTVPFVAYGILRYLFLIYRENRGETPEEILIKDRPLLVNVLLWLGTATIVLFLNA